MSETVKGGQVIYGWIERGAKKGHQMVTHSEGISSGDLAFIDSHSTVNPYNMAVFKECNRFFELPSGKLAFNYVKNIGKDAYGRNGALYSHFIIMSPDDFIRAGKNFMKIEELHLKGINSISDLQRFNSGGGYIPLPETSAEIDPDRMILENNLNQRNIIYELLQIIKNSMRVIFKGESIENRLSALWSMEHFFPDGIWFSYSTCLEGNYGDTFISVTFPENTKPLEDFGKIIDIDDAASFPNQPISNTTDKLLWAIAGALASKGKHINDSLKSMKFHQKTGIERISIYFNSLAEAYFDLAVSGDVDQHEALEAILEFIDTNPSIDTKIYEETLSQLVAENTDLMREFIRHRMGSIALEDEPDMAVKKFMDLFKFVISKSTDSLSVELLYSLYSESSLVKNKLCFQEMVDYVNGFEDFPDSLLQFLDVADVIFAEWLRNIMKGKDQNIEDLESVINLLIRMKNRENEISFIIQKIFNDTVKKNPEKIDVAIQCFIEYSGRVGASFKKDMSEHVLELIEKEKIDPMYDYEKILLEMSERAPDDEEVPKKRFFSKGK